MGWFTKPDYNLYTDGKWNRLANQANNFVNIFDLDEAHAEMCYADGTFMSMVLDFLADQSLLSLIRMAMKYRTVYSTTK